MILKLLKCLYFLCLISVTGAMADTSTNLPLPENVVSMSNSRETKLANITFTGEMSVESRIAPDPVKVTQGLQRSVQRSYQNEYSQVKNSIPKNVFDNMVKQNLMAIAKQGEGWDISSVHSWTIARAGLQTLTTGTYQDSPSVIATYRQFYAGQNVLLVNDSDVSPNDGAIKPSGPDVFSAPGDAIHYRFPKVKEGLGLLPEDFVMLAGINSLSLYGASWKTIAHTDKTLTIFSHNNSDVNDPFDITIVLNQNKGSLPTEITVSGRSWLVHYAALGFQQYDNIWICSKYSRTETAPGLYRVREWSLSKMNSTIPLTVSVNQPINVSDYRLLGPTSTLTSILNAEEHNSTNISHYLWKGDFPSITDIQSLHDQKYPGESTPDPGTKSSALPGALGLLCLAAGVMTYRRRDKRKE
jgi:hypothetical protein